MDSGIPASKIAAFTFREFDGLFVDNPDEKIELKMVLTKIINDADMMNVKVSHCKNIPVVSEHTQQQGNG